MSLENAPGSPVHWLTHIMAPFLKKKVKLILTLWYSWISLGGMYVELYVPRMYVWMYVRDGIWYIRLCVLVEGELLRQLQFWINHCFFPGVCYLYLKTIERAHLPRRMWEKIRLPFNTEKAHEKIEEHMRNVYKEHQIKRCKSKYDALLAMIKRARKLVNSPSWVFEGYESIHILRYLIFYSQSWAYVRD